MPSIRTKGGETLPMTLADSSDAKAEEKQLDRLEKELKHAEKEEAKLTKAEHHSVSVSGQMLTHMKQS